MNRLLGSAACLTLSLACTAAPAALVPTLISNSGPAGNTTYTYSVQLTGDQGLSTSAPNPSAGNRVGSQFVIYDFVGYRTGSIFSTLANFTFMAELLSPGLPEQAGATDDAALYNLHFTYTGPDYRTSGGPYSLQTLGTVGASSTLAGVSISDYSSVGVNNNSASSGTVGTAAFNQGSVWVPGASGSVPEPASWAMMVGGFGLLGCTLRRRRQVTGLA